MAFPTTAACRTARTLACTLQWISIPALVLSWSSESALAACTPAAVDGVTALCSGSTLNQDTGAPGTSAGSNGYGSNTYMNVTVLPGATVTGTQEGISAIGNGPTPSLIVNEGTITGLNSDGIGSPIVSGGVSVNNSGTISGVTGIFAGKVAVTNSGVITGGTGSGIQGVSTVNVTNTGSISGSNGVQGQAVLNLTNSGTITGTGAGGFGVINTTSLSVSIFNAGTISGQTGIGLSDGFGAQNITNAGTIVGTSGVAINYTQGAPPFGATNVLTVLPGSHIVGAIDFGAITGGGSNTVNINASNQNLTFDTLAGATVNGNVPFVVAGNQIASVDPTPFGIADKNLMAFTGAMWGLLGSRGNSADPGGESGPLGFAGADTPSYVDDAFAQVMGYAKAPSDAVFFKNPTMTTSDGTTVWAKGFYGQRTQQADGPNLRNVTRFYGGAIGLDRMVSPDLRLGGFAGGGSTSTVIDLNSGTARSDIGFGGVYGRKDIGTVFVDFALLGGVMSNRTMRNINNNLAANGLETATGSFGGWFVSPELAVGKRYAIDAIWSLTPTARLRYLAAGFDGYTETGSTSNLSVGSRTLQNVEERGDLTLTRRQTFANADRIFTSVYAGLLGQQRLGDSAINTILLGQALAFATPGKTSIGGVYAGGGIEWRTGNHFSMFASAEYAAMTDSSNTVTGRAGLRYGF